MIPEIAMYAELLREARARIFKTLNGLSGDALNWRPVPDGSNSLYALAIHCLGAERRWIHQIVGGRTIARDRDAEFRALADNLETLEATYDEAAIESERVFADLDDLKIGETRSDGKKDYAVRWCILHIVEHYNEHLGQMALTRQLWENRTARPHEI
jgi:uncharacterized damage-inducible protein DinB